MSSSPRKRARADSAFEELNFKVSALEDQHSRLSDDAKHLDKRFGELLAKLDEFCAETKLNFKQINERLDTNAKESTVNFLFDKLVD